MDVIYIRSTGLYEMVMRYIIYEPAHLSMCVCNVFGKIPSTFLCLLQHNYA